MSRSSKINLNELDMDAASRHPRLQPLLAAPARKLTVEFLRTEGAQKPHVVLKVNFGTVITLGRSNYKGCTLSMEYMGGGKIGLDGEFQVKLVSYADATTADAAFEFPIPEGAMQPLLKYINLFRGRLGNDADGLTQFSFWMPLEAKNWMDVVISFGWEVCAIPKGQLNNNDVLSWNFRNLIGNSYLAVNDNGVERTTVRRFPLYRGIFYDGYPASGGASGGQGGSSNYGAGSDSNYYPASGANTSGANQGGWSTYYPASDSNASGENKGGYGSNYYSQG